MCLLYKQNSKYKVYFLTKMLLFLTKSILWSLFLLVSKFSGSMRTNSLLFYFAAI